MKLWLHGPPAKRLSRRCAEEIAQRLEWCVFHDEGLAEAARQDQGNAAVADLFVLAYMAEQPVGRDSRQPYLGQSRRQAAACEVRNARLGDLCNLCDRLGYIRTAVVANATLTGS